MNVRIFLFEDKKQPNFHPLTLTRPLWDLRVGILTIGEKWVLEFPDALVEGEVRPELDGVFESRVCLAVNGLGDNNDLNSHRLRSELIDQNIPTLHINCRYLPTASLIKQLKNWLIHPGKSMEFIHQEGNERVMVAKGFPAIGAAEAGDAGAGTSVQTGNSQPGIEDEILLGELEWIVYPWDLLDKNGPEIRRDIDRISAAKNSVFSKDQQAHKSIHPHVYVEELSQVYLHPEAQIEPGVTIQTGDGPVFIGAGARIMAGSHLRGPLAIGDGVVIKMGALLYKNSTIGPYSKVGGEVSNCIFHSYSNKAHHGYAGNSIFGQWVNLGAGTTTSNLRGNYGEVRVTHWVTRQEIPTGRQFLGSILGDHVKTGINSILNTGTVVGPSSMIFGAGFAPKWIDSFSWLNSDKGQTDSYDVEKSLVDMQRMMARRDISLSEAYEKMMRRLYSGK